MPPLYHILYTFNKLSNLYKHLKKKKTLLHTFLDKHINLQTYLLTSSSSIQSQRENNFEIKKKDQ